MSEAQDKTDEPQAKPAFTWDSAEQADDGDFLKDITGQAAPSACSLDEPDCTACQ